MGRATRGKKRLAKKLIMANYCQVLIPQHRICKDKNTGKDCIFLSRCIEKADKMIITLEENSFLK